MQATLDGSGTVNLKNGARLAVGGDATLTGSLDLEGAGKFLWSEGSIGGLVDAGVGVKTDINDVASDARHDRALTTLDTKKPAQLIVEGGATQHSLTPIDLGPGPR